MAMLDERIFLSVQDLAKMMCIQSTLVYRRLTNFMCFIVRQFCRILHELNDVQLATKVQMSNKLLKIICLAEHQD
jgi:hypothetical protein